MSIHSTILLAVTTVLLLNGTANAQQVDQRFLSTEQLWDKGKAAYVAGQNSSGGQAVRHYADSLAYLYAYLQRNDQLASGDDQHARRLRSAIRETHQYLTALQAGAEVKGDLPGATPQTVTPDRPSTSLRDPGRRPRSKAIFSYPRARNGRRVDWCAVWGNQCGRAAAQSFCRSHGFANVTSFSIDRDIGELDPTYVASADRVCSAQFCDGFREIICTR